MKTCSLANCTFHWRVIVNIYVKINWKKNNFCPLWQLWYIKCQCYLQNWKKLLETMYAILSTRLCCFSETIMELSQIMFLFGVSIALVDALPWSLGKIHLMSSFIFQKLERENGAWANLFQFVNPFIWSNLMIRISLVCELRASNCSLISWKFLLLN